MYMSISFGKFAISLPPSRLTFFAVCSKSIEISVPDGPTPITSTFRPLHLEFYTKVEAKFFLSIFSKIFNLIKLKKTLAYTHRVDDRHASELLSQFIDGIYIAL